MNKEIKAFGFTTTLTCAFSVICLLFGRIFPIVSTELLGGIYISETKVFVGMLIFTMIVANLLNLLCERLTYFEIFVNVSVCIFSQSILRIYDQSKISVIIFLGFILVMSLVIFFIRKKNKRKINLLFYVKNLIFLGLVFFIIPAQFIFNLSEGIDYLSYAEIATEEKNSVGFSELKRKIHNTEWRELDLNEKTELLALLIANEAKELGIKSVPDIVVEDFKNSYTYAFYEKQKIHFNVYYLGQSQESSESINSAAHELYHAYQMELLEEAEKLSDKTLNYKIFEPVVKWMEAKENYSNDKAQFGTYYNNALEQDARAYADEILKKYDLISAD